jgi:hypothetical protein
MVHFLWSGLARTKSGFWSGKDTRAYQLEAGRIAGKRSLLVLVSATEKALSPYVAFIG